MATSYKIDLLPSTYTIGIGSALFDRAERYAIVRGALNNPNHEALDDAINFLVSTLGVFHHRNLTLPLQRVTAKKHDSSNVLVVMEYFRRRLSIPANPSQLAKYRSTTLGSQWYRTPVVDPSVGGPAFDSDGRPAGALQFTRGGAKFLEFPPPVPWQWERPAITVHIPFQLTANPIGAVAFRLSTTNLNPVSYSGYSFPSNYLLFAAVNVDVEQTGVGAALSYNGSYDFVTAKGGFVFQSAYYDTTSAPYAWLTKLTNLYPQTDFVSPPFP